MDEPPMMLLRVPLDAQEIVSLMRGVTHGLSLTVVLQEAETGHLLIGARFPPEQLAEVMDRLVELEPLQTGHLHLMVSPKQRELIASSLPATAVATTPTCAPTCAPVAKSRRRRANNHDSEH